MALGLNGGTNVITGLAVGGLPDGTVDADTLASGTSFVSYAVICDQQSLGTDGGTFTAGAWRTRDLNTELIDPDGIVSISSNQFTLGSAGTYFFEWGAPGYRCNGHLSQLYDVTGSASVAVGFNAFSDSGNDGDTCWAIGWARDTITGSNTYEIQHQCSNSENTYGLGRSFDLDVERYTYVRIFKES
jgi:hypothetical protein